MLANKLFTIPQCNMSRYFFKQRETAGFRAKRKSLEVSRGWMSPLIYTVIIFYWRRYRFSGRFLYVRGRI